MFEASKKRKGVLEKKKEKKLLAIRLHVKK